MPYHCHICHQEHATQELCPHASNPPMTATEVLELRKNFKIEIKSVKNQKHYMQYKIQPATFIAANNIGYFEGNVIKYVCRYQLKNGIEDLKKAQHYLEMLIEKLETGEVKL